jgi:hypothetical protein
VSDQEHTLPPDALPDQAVPAVPRTQEPTHTTPDAPKPMPRPPSGPTVEITTQPSPPGASAEADFTDQCQALHPGAPRVPGHFPVRRLGSGTFGQVWLYQEERSRRRVAIKFLNRPTGQDWLLLQAEVKQLALLDGDPGIVQLKDVEPDAFPPYYVMTYAEGGSLAARLENGPLPVREALRLGTQVTRALAYVHAKGVRHCDLKPGNVLLDAVGRALVGDFGQAHLASDLSPALGTFFYMAPEQADLRQTIPDTRWDVYGLGALFYAMLTGQPPRSDQAVRDRLANTPHLGRRLELYREHLHGAPPPRDHRRVPGVDRHLAAVIDRCLEVDPGRRLRDAGAVLAALEQRRRILRHRPVLFFGLLTPLLLLLGVGVFARWAVSDTLDRSQAALVGQLQGSDLAAARLVANIIEDELADRIQIIEERARGHELRQAVAERRGPAHLEDLLRRYRRRAGKRFDAWFLVDGEGRLLAYVPDGAAGRRVNLRWRGWFHGGGDRYDDRTGHFEPVRRTHISQPYRGRIRDGGPAIALSTPVFAPGARPGGRPSALLVVRFSVAELHSWLEGVQIGEDGFVVLVNDHGQVLLHRDARALTPPADRPPPSHTGHPIYQRLLRDREAGSDTYTDPVDGGDYLVSFAPFTGRQAPEARWGALVQHDRREALRPVENLRERMRLVGALALGVAALLTFGLWGWLIRTLRREEALARA